MNEDFGWAGDEFVIGDCGDDHFIPRYWRDEIDINKTGLFDDPDDDPDEWDNQDEEDEDVNNWDKNDVPMDGDEQSALASAGFGTDEDYGYYGEES